MASTSVYLVQLDSRWEDKAANFAQVRSLLSRAAPAPGSLIVLPEMFATGFSDHLDATLEPVEGPTTAFLRELAVGSGCTVLGGLVTPAGEGRGYNQALAVAPDGSAVARYSKVHPFRLGGEAAVHARGQGVVLFEWAGLKVAPLICYDLRFPELAREAVRAGAEMLIYLASWPVKRQQHWLTLLQARAIENQAYVIGVNRCGSDPRSTHSGRSVVVDPHGFSVADAGEQERVVCACIEPGLVREWRADFPAVREFLDAGQG